MPRVILVTLWVLSVGAAQTGRASTPSTDLELPSQYREVLPAYVQLLRDADSLVAYAVGQHYSGCTPGVEVPEPMIDCFEVFAVGRPVAPQSIDSLADWLVAPGSLVRLRSKVCACSPTWVLRARSAQRDATIWLCPGCGEISLHGLGDVYADAPGGIGWMDRLAAGTFSEPPSWRIDGRPAFELPYYDTAPVMVQEPVRDDSLRIVRGAPPDTVVVDAFVESSGRIGAFRIIRGRDRIDRNVAAMIRTAIYKPALQRDLPVRAMIRIEVPMPARPAQPKNADPQK